MTKISRYVIDDKVTGSDKWIGSDAQTQYTTKNFTPTKLAVYFNENQVIDIGTPIRYKYDILEVGDTRLPGTITFNPQVGTPYSLSSISSFILSKYTLKGNDVTQYLNFLIGSNVLIYKADDINIFGLYKVVSLVENIDEPDFFDVVVSYITGNGSIVEDKDYLVSLIDIPGGDIPTKTSDLINDGEDGVHPFITLEDIPIPNLNDVLLEGNTATNNINLIGNYYGDNFYINTGGFGLMDDGTLLGQTFQFVNSFNSYLYTSSSSLNTWELPNQSGTIALTSDIPAQGLTSVGLSMPIAFNVANSPLTSNGTLAVSAAGTSSQYIRGDGQLATFPTSGGGGSSVSYYLNGSINASVAGYKQLSNTATIGGGTDFTLVGNGLIAQFLTDLGNPNRTEIPGGAWNFEMFFQASSAGGNQKFYVELLKYNGTTFTLIASSILVPEEITGGTAIDLYLTSLAVPTTPLLVTDRLAIRVYIVDNAVGRTITLHTEDNTLCEIITTFSGGVTSLNGLTANTQYLAVGTTGTDFNISSLTDTHTFNLPTASALNRGALSSTDWTAFNDKFTLPSLTSGSVLFSNGTTIAQDNSNFFWDDTNNRLNIGGITSNTARLGIKAPGALGTDIALRVRNSADTADLLFIDGLGNINFTNINNSSFIKNNLGTYIELYNTSTGNMNFNTSYSSGSYVFRTQGTDKMRLNSAGNLLINTTTDQGGKLQIKAPGALSTDIALRVRNSADSGDFMTVNGLGNVGIGIAPSYKLDVNGTVRFANGLIFETDSGSRIFSSNNIQYQSNNSTLQHRFTNQTGTSLTGTLFQIDTGGALLSNPVNLIKVINQSTDVLYLKASGNLLIGTATDNGGKLQIKAPGALSTDIVLRVRNSADTADLMNIQGDGRINFNSTLAVGSNNFYSSGENRTRFYSTAQTTDNLQIYTNGGAYGSVYGEIGFGFKNTSTQSGTINFDTRTSVAPFRFFVNASGASSIDAMDIFRSGSVGIGTANTEIASAILTANSTTKGFLPPRMTTTEKNAIATPASGLVVYDTTLGKLCVRGASAWETITSV